MRNSHMRNPAPYRIHEPPSQILHGADWAGQNRTAEDAEWEDLCIEPS